MARNTKVLDDDLSKLENEVAAYMASDDEWKSGADSFGKQVLDLIAELRDKGTERYEFVLGRIRDLQQGHNHHNQRFRALERDVKLLTKQRGREVNYWFTLPVAIFLGVTAGIAWSNIDFRQTVEGLEEPIVYKYAESGWSAFFVGLLVTLVIYCIAPRRYVLDDEDSNTHKQSEVDKTAGGDDPTAPMGTPAVDTTKGSVKEPATT